MDTCALNHHFWKSFPAAIRTIATITREISVPITDTMEKAAAHKGSEKSITAMVVGGENVEGNDLTPVFLSLSISIWA